MVTKRDYDAMQVEAARSVMLELVRLLGEYRDDIVVIGGWVPALLIPQDKVRHIGSIDVDIALNHKTLKEPGYKSICRLLLERGYRQDERQPFIFWRTVTVSGKSIDVEVDLLAGEYEGTGKSHRTQAIQDARARKARGCELAFQLNEEITIEGTLPDDGKDRACVRLATIVAFIVMKGMALSARLKEKDAWDIYYCVKHYPGGPDALAAKFLPLVKHGLIKEGLQKIAEKFASPEHSGPGSVAHFEEITDIEERNVIKRDAYERVNHLLQKLGIV